MWHVLEHLPNPLEALAEVSRLLKPGGWFIAMVPNIASFEFQIFQADWLHLDLPRHLYHFSPRTLQQMLEKANLAALRIAFQIEPLSLEDSLRNLLRIKRQPSGAGLRYFRGFLWILSFLLAQVQSSGVIVVYACKKGPRCNYDDRAR